MVDDRENAFRPLLEEDPPAFGDKVNTPWDRVPDVPGYNQPAYNRIVRALKVLERERVDGRREGVSTANTQGVLVLGEAGTGKTHLLMRVANNLGGANHILFVTRPTDRHTVTARWQEVIAYSRETGRWESPSGRVLAIEEIVAARCRAGETP